MNRGRSDIELSKSNQVLFNQQSKINLVERLQDGVSVVIILKRYAPDKTISGAKQTEELPFDKRNRKKWSHKDKSRVKVCPQHNITERMKLRRMVSTELNLILKHHTNSIE